MLDGTWTEPSEETVDMLMDFHFSDSGSVLVDDGPSAVVQRAETKGR